MREVKFRCWHLLGEDLDKKKFRPAMLYDTKPGDCLRWLSDGQKIEAIMQYTGLNDRNGKEIFEGDILRHEYSYDIFVVKWDDEEAGFNLFNRFNKFVWGNIGFGTEIIGNIYESQELLEEK